MTDLSPYFYQVAFITPDLDAAAAWFQNTMGIPHFERLDDVAFDETISYRGAPADSSANLALGFAGDTQIELIQPIRGQSLYQEFLDAGRTGLHHLGFVVPDLAATTTSLRADGLECVTEGVMEGAMRVAFAYFDSGPHAASLFEILEFDDAARAFMADLKAKGH